MARNWRKDGVSTPPSLKSSGLTRWLPYCPLQLADAPPVLSVEVHEGCAAEIAEIRTAPVERELPGGQSVYASFFKQSARLGERERERVSE